MQAISSNVLKPLALDIFQCRVRGEAARTALRLQVIQVSMERNVVFLSDKHFSVEAVFCGCLKSVVGLEGDLRSACLLRGCIISISQWHFTCNLKFNNQVDSLSNPSNMEYLSSLPLFFIVIESFSVLGESMNVIGRPECLLSDVSVQRMLKIVTAAELDIHYRVQHGATVKEATLQPLFSQIQLKDCIIPESTQKILDHLPGWPEKHPLVPSQVQTEDFHSQAHFESLGSGNWPLAQITADSQAYDTDFFKETDSRECKEDHCTLQSGDTYVGTDCRKNMCEVLKNEKSIAESIHTSLLDFVPSKAQDCDTLHASISQKESSESEFEYSDKNLPSDNQTEEIASHGAKSTDLLDYVINVFTKPKDDLIDDEAINDTDSCVGDNFKESKSQFLFTQPIEECGYESEEFLFITTHQRLEKANHTEQTERNSSDVLKQNKVEKRSAILLSQDQVQNNNRCVESIDNECSKSDTNVTNQNSEKQIDTEDMRDRQKQIDLECSDSVSNHFLVHDNQDNATIDAAIPNIGSVEQTQEKNNVIDDFKSHDVHREGDKPSTDQTTTSFLNSMSVSDAPINMNSINSDTDEILSEDEVDSQKILSFNFNESLQSTPTPSYFPSLLSLSLSQQDRGIPKPQTIQVSNKKADKKLTKSMSAPTSSMKAYLPLHPATWDLDKAKKAILKAVDQHSESLDEFDNVIPFPILSKTYDRSLSQYLIKNEPTQRNNKRCYDDFYNTNNISKKGDMTKRLKFSDHHKKRPHSNKVVASDRLFALSQNVAKVPKNILKRNLTS